MRQDNCLRWTWWRAWFPVVFFIAFWVNSWLNYNFGFLIRDPLSTQTQVYIIMGVILFAAGYAIGLGRPKRVLYRTPADLLIINGQILQYAKPLLWLTFIGVFGLIADRILSGAGSLSSTLNETEFVREEMMANTTIFTTISMGVFAFSLVAFSLYYIWDAAHYRAGRLYDVLVYTVYALLCFSSVLMASRGYFFTVSTFLLFGVFFVRGDSLWLLLVGRKYMLARIIFSLFLVVALTYFFFISRHRGGEDGLQSDTIHYFKPADRYGLYRLNFDELDVSAFLLTYSYMTEGYQYIEVFREKAPMFAFRPSMLFGTRSLRQVNRFLPERLQISPAAIEIGNSWRVSAGQHLYGWPTIWGWNLAMFGYLGSQIFMFLYGLFLGYSSGTYLRYGSAGALMVCFANYSVLINSYNSLGGDVYHQVAIWTGVWLLLKSRTNFKRIGYG